MKKITREERIKVRKRFEASMRKLWLESKYRSQALTAAKESTVIGKYNNGNTKYKVKYRCAQCGNLFEEGNVEVDHIEELDIAKWNIPMDEEMENLIPWLRSLFCEADNLQVLCLKCHKRKTLKYAQYRKLGAHLL